MDEFCCPFCGFKTETNYSLMYHLESLHPEGESPFIVKNDCSESGISVTLEATEAINNGLELVDCPRESCGEIILLTELESHLSLHNIEDSQDEDDVSQNANPSKRGRTTDSEPEVNFDTRLPPALRNLVGNRHLNSSSLPDRQFGAKASWREMLNMTGSRHKPRAPLETPKAHRRLGKSELGPYAHEKQMPSWLRQLLEADGKAKTTSEISRTGKLSRVKIVENQVSGVIPVIEQLLCQDLLTEYAYICHPCVQHVSKLQKEGGFCGYRNIQMMASYINGVESQGCQHFGRKLPTIFQIQEFIEHAWDIGINAQGRLETGGIRGTRKYIGTPEVQAMLLSLDIACNAQGLRGRGNFCAEHLLLQHVEEYFSSGCVDPESKVRGTALGPLYFQHPGHSMTIIGFEKKMDGTANLLVFDPMFHDSAEIIKLVGRKFICKNPSDLLRAYRRSVKYLRKYKEFEVMKQVTRPNTWLSCSDYPRLTPPERGNKQPAEK